MGFPRDYLDFTTWYLERKGYITKADNSDFTLTAAGVDFVETERGQIPVLNKLLTATAGPTSDGIEGENKRIEKPQPLILPDEAPIVERRASTEDRRVNKRDRRSGAPDLRANPIERRFRTEDRRSGVADRRAKSAKDKADSKTKPED
jgi:hypothetical protein